MHLRIAICTKKAVYADRLQVFLDKNYKDKLEINLFYELRYLDEYLGNHNLDFILFGEEWKEKVEDGLEKYPPHAYLIEMPCYRQDEEDACMEIKMYQRGDRLFRDLISAYAAYGQIRKEDGIRKEEGRNSRIYVFLSVSGGAGASTVAEAFAKKCAKTGHVLELDMQFCSGREAKNGHGMDEILFALKSRRYILPLKLEAGVQIADDRVSGLSLCSNPMDLLNISGEEMRQLLDAIRQSGHFDKVIADMDTVLGEKERVLIEEADRIICVVDGSDVCMNKFTRFYKALTALEQISGGEIRNKLFAFQNRRHGGTKETDYAGKTAICGSAPKYQEAPWKDIVYTMETNANFDGM